MAPSAASYSAGMASFTLHILPQLKEGKKKPARHAPGERTKSKWENRKQFGGGGRAWKRSPEKEASEQWEARMQFSTQKWMTQDTQEVGWYAMQLLQAG